MALCVSLAVFIIWHGGVLGIIVTDTIQGLICLPIMVVLCIFLLRRFGCFLRFLRRHHRLLAIDGLLLLGLGLQALLLLHHGGIVRVHPVHHVQARRELLERGGIEKNLDERHATRTVHLAGALSQPLLQVGDLGLQLDPTGFGGVARRLGFLLRCHSLAVFHGKTVERLLHRVQVRERFLSFSLFFGRCHGMGALGAYARA